MSEYGFYVRNCDLKVSGVTARRPTIEAKTDADKRIRSIDKINRSHVRVVVVSDCCGLGNFDGSPKPVGEFALDFVGPKFDFMHRGSERQELVPFALPAQNRHVTRLVCADRPPDWYDPSLMKSS